MNAPRLDGPRLAPASGGAPGQLVVICHGYGADGNDLIALGQAWQRVLPHAAFVAPNAPERCEMSPMGFQWFPLTMRDPGEWWRGVQQAGPVLDAFIDAELARHGLTDDALALVGFSQGTAMALHVGLRRKAAAAGILGFSGRLAGAEHLKDEITVKPPVVLVHGDADPVVPVAALEEARTTLAAAGVAVRWHVCPGLGHGIDPQGLAAGAQFLAGTLTDATAADL